MSFYSMEYVRPAYYDKVLTGKVSRDEDSVEMMELITTTTHYDLGFLLLTDNFLHVQTGLRGAVSNGDPAASFVAANEEAVAATLEKAMEAVRANKGA